MLNYIESLNMPAQMTLIFIILFSITQAVGELLEIKGRVVPEVVKIRKFFKRKKEEHDTLARLPETFKNIEDLLNEVNLHYSEDNMAKRNSWMKWVNDRAEVYDAGLVDLSKKIDENNKTILELLIDNKRDIIIRFASKVTDSSFLVTKEQFNRVFRVYEEYEKIIKENDIKNGEVDIAIRIIRESYEEHIKNHSFIEDVRGYYSL